MIYPQRFRILKVMIHHIFATIIVVGAFFSLKVPIVFIAVYVVVSTFIQALRVRMIKGLFIKIDGESVVYNKRSINGAERPENESITILRSEIKQVIKTANLFTFMFTAQPPYAMELKNGEEIALAGVFTRADAQDVAHALGVPLGKGE